MIAEFEQRLAEVLGTRLPAPFAGRVRVAPSDVPDGEAAVTLGVVRAERLRDPLGGPRPTVAPGAPAPRRVASLRCTVAVELRPATGQGRPQLVRGLDALLYELEDPGLRHATALAGGPAPDPGFLVQALAVASAAAPLAPGPGSGEDGDAPVALELVAEGLFWPVGAAGETGTAIAEVRLRGAVLPLEIEVEALPRPGGAAVGVTVRVGTTGIDLRAGQEPAALPFDRLAMTLRGPGGRAGAGSLEGGTSGAQGVRLALLQAGEAKVRYAPPAAPAVDEVVVGLDDGEGGVGIELGRRAVQVGT